MLRLRRKRRPTRPVSAQQKAARQAARLAILAKVDYWSEVMGITPKRVAIRDQRSRWGSASSLGNLNFSWRITLMPETVFDYIVIHELAHLRELNHSRAYWAIVSAYSPRYRQHRQWLARHGSSLHRLQT